MDLKPVEKDEILQHNRLTGIATSSAMTEASQSSRALDYLEYSSDFIAGYVGGVTGIIVGHPFDTIKVQQQVAKGKVPSISKCSTEILRDEGMRGFFRGMAFPVVAVGFLNSIFFGVYGNTKRFLNNVQGKKKDDPFTYWDIFIAGGIGGGIQGIPATPIELIKVKLQAQRKEIEELRKAGKKVKPLYNGPMSCMNYVYKTEGMKGCFRGLNATILREIPGFSSYIMSYEFMCRKVTPEDQEVSIRTMFMAGGFAGMVSWIINIPVDVIKTRLQTDSSFRGFLDCFVKSYRSDGWTVFYRGLPAMCLRAFPTNAVTLTVYSVLLRHIGTQIEERR